MIISKIIDVFRNPVSKWQLKIFFAISALTIAMAVVVFTTNFVDEIVVRERKSIELYKEFYTKLNSNEDYSQSSIDNKAEVYITNLNLLAITITIPIILTDADDKPLEEFSAYTLNVDLSKYKTIAEQRTLLTQMIADMKKDYQPILIPDQNGQIINKIYYTDSKLVKQLRFFPYLSISLFGLFILVAYLAFSNIRRNEQSKVWVGMAREAAHQLGTPLSSLLAWVEILRYGKDSPIALDETLNEIDKDVNRLQIITQRFSKIGSKPELEELNLTELIENVCLYFEKRLPHLGRKVDIVRRIDKQVYAYVNADLFAWVFENLLKNAAEAMEIKHGEITLSYASLSKHKIVIYVKDTGKGMSKKMRRQIFYPGYTTKKRGWGLGLSLSKRIVEEYHAGKIYVKDSSPGKGTTFAIEIPVEIKKNNIDK